MYTRRLFILVLVSLLGFTAVADGIVSAVVKAPITPDGDVASAPTDLVIDFPTTLDPAFDGIALNAGCAIRLTLPEEFIKTSLPVKDLFTENCTPGNFQCTTGVMLQGWPQHPILPHFPPTPGPATEYTLTPDGSNTLVFTALNDLQAPFPGAAPGPGLKQIHLINGFTNPARPGFYPVQVEFTEGSGCTMAQGTANVHILPKIRPSINVTSVFNPGSPNTIYQTVAAAWEDAPFAWDFLLWDGSGGPMEGVNVVMVHADFALLKQGEKVVGHIEVDAPNGAQGHAVAGGPSFSIPGPIKLVPAGRLSVQFSSGSVSGRYSSTISLLGGNSVKMFVDVP